MITKDDIESFEVFDSGQMNDYKELLQQFYKQEHAVIYPALGLAVSR